MHLKILDPVRPDMDAAQPINTCHLQKVSDLCRVIELGLLLLVILFLHMQQNHKLKLHVKQPMFVKALLTNIQIQLVEVTQIIGIRLKAEYSHKT